MKAKLKDFHWEVRKWCGEIPLGTTVYVAFEGLNHALSLTDMQLNSALDDASATRPATARVGWRISEPRCALSFGSRLDFSARRLRQSGAFRLLEALDFVDSLFDQKPQDRCRLAQCADSRSQFGELFGKNRLRILVRHARTCACATQGRIIPEPLTLRYRRIEKRVLG